MPVSSVIYFWGDFLIPSEVTKLMGCEPASSQVKGNTLGKIGIKAASQTGDWSVCLDVDSLLLEDHLRHVLDNYSSTIEQLYRLNLVDQAKLSIFVSGSLMNNSTWESGQVAHDILGELARSKISLSFVFMCFDKNDS